MNRFYQFLTLIILVTLFACKDKTPQSDENLAQAASLSGKVYTAVPEASEISWEGKKPTGTHKGTIGIKEGSLAVNEGKLTGGSFVIDMKSIVVNDLEGEEKANLEAHLMGTVEEKALDFFNTNKFPTSKFEITSVTDSADPNANSLVTGNLTMLDITKEVKIPAQINVTDTSLLVSTMPFSINRTDWGINYKSKNIFKELGDKFIDDNITIAIKVSAK